MVNADLATALQLSENCTDEEATSSIVSLLISAVRDSEPPKTLSEIYHIVTNFGATSYLDPLNTIPLLLPCTDLAAKNLISVIGECGPAKEVVMTVQEALERLEREMKKEDEDEDEDEDDAGENRKGQDPAPVIKCNSLVERLVILCDLYAAAIPRIKLRRKSASETLQPLLEEIESILNIAGSRATHQEDRDILCGIANLSSNIAKWSAENNSTNEEDREACKTIIRRLLDVALTGCSPASYTSVAQRTLERYYPRLAFRSQSQSAEYTGEKEIMGWLDAYNTLGLPPETFDRQPSASDLVYYAYSPPNQIDPERLLSFILPVLIYSVRGNMFLSESLAVLISCLYAWKSTKPTISLPHDITLPLCGLLPTIASAHPDPAIRHQTFRVISLLLSASDPRLRFQYLIEYTRDSEYPQMRVASVGLVKEALLQSLSNSLAKDDPLASSLFLKTFGPILFRPDPPNLFSSALTLQEFQDTPEPGRLIECLSLYYVIFQRDTLNLTGIKDKDVHKSIETSLLLPLRANIKQWVNDSEKSNGHIHDISPVVSLKIAIERVDSVVER